MSQTPAESAVSITFSDLDLIEPIARAVREKGYEKPSPIQAQSHRI